MIVRDVAQFGSAPGSGLGAAGSNPVVPTIFLFGWSKGAVGSFFYYLKAEEMTFISSAFFRDGTDLFLCQEIKEILHGLFSKLHIPSPINDKAGNAHDMITRLPVTMMTDHGHGP